MSAAYIDIKDATMRFRIYHNPIPGLKETFVQKLTGRRKRDSYTEFDALKNINLQINSGDRLGILGLNGAGKSTLLKMIVGIYPPNAGVITVQGKMTPLIELGMGFDFELSGRENIYLQGALLGRSLRQMRMLEPAIIEFSELQEHIEVPIKYYSSGMLSRLAFSIGTIVDAEILLIDEIFAAGDAHFRAKANQRMMSVLDNSQIVVVVSHDSGQIKELCNRAIVLHKGEIVNDGDPAEMISYYYREVAKVQEPAA